MLATLSFSSSPSMIQSLLLASTDLNSSNVRRRPMDVFAICWAIVARPET